MDTKITKFIAISILLIGMVLFLSGCVNPVNIPEASPYTPTLSKITSSPSATAIVPATEPTLPPYPTSSENFTKTPSISGAEAEKRIIEFGAGADLSALKDWYKANGIASSNMLPVVYEEAGDVHWDLAAKGTNGNFLKFTITSGVEKDQIVRAMGMVSYLYNRPEFKVSELIKSAELNGTTQQMIWDKSGWSVIGAFKGESLVGWFNADKNVWIMEQSQQGEPSATPEPIQENFSYSSSINPDRLAAVLNSLSLNFNEYSWEDLTDKLHFPLVYVSGYPVAYSLERDENGTQFFILLATGGGLIKANVGVFNFGGEAWPQTMHEISRIDDKEAREISESVDNFIKQINEGDKFKNSRNYIILVTMNTEADSRACLVNHRGLENAKRLCAYDPTNETLTPEMMLGKIKDSITPAEGKNPQDALNLENYPALSSEGNMYVNFQS